MNATILFLATLILAGIVIIEAEFSPVELSLSPSQQCERQNPDLTGVLATVAQMILNKQTSLS